MLTTIYSLNKIFIILLNVLSIMKILFYFMLISSFAKYAGLILIINNKYLNNFN